MTGTPNSFVFPPARVMLGVSQNSRRAALQSIARQIAADLNLHIAGTADMLAAGKSIAQIADGIAVIDQCSEQIESPYLLIARLTHGVDFHAPDHKPVDLICLLLSPPDNRIDHIRVLGRLTRQIHQQDFADKIRTATSEDAVRAVFIAPTPDAIAA